MEKKLTEIICGSGRGKTAMAMGKSIQASLTGKSVIIIQFLKGSERGELSILEKLDDLDVKFFRFEKQETIFSELSEQEQAEEKINIVNGINFARKVIATRECDFLVLDEILGVIDMGIVTKELVTDMLSQRDGSMEIILTGMTLPDWIVEHVDIVTEVRTSCFN